MKSIIFILAGVLFNFYETIAQEFSNCFGLYHASGINPDSIPDSILVSSRVFSDSIPFLDSNFYSNTVMLNSSQNFITFYNDSTMDSTLSSGLRLLSSSTGNSTSENSFKKSPVVFPSPNAFSFTNIPKEGVDLYNGILKYELPLYSFKYDNIEVPIVLRYNDGGGVKVNEIASWVGLGLSLIVGGNISRVMHSLPDEYNYTWTAINGLSMPAIGYLNLQSHGVNLANFNSSGQNDREQIVDFSNFYSLDGYCLNYGGTCPDAYDTEPDEFYFNFGSYSGKFVFKQNGEIVLIPQQDFQISKTVVKFNGIDKIVSFTVKTSDGFTYTFGDNNLNSVDESKLLTLYAKTKYEYQHMISFPDAICSLNGGNIYYSKPIIRVTTSRSGDLVFDDWWHNPHDNLTLTQMDYFTSSWHLKSISTPAGSTVNFTYANETAVNFLQSRSVTASFACIIIY